MLDTPRLRIARTACREAGVKRQARLVCNPSRASHRSCFLGPSHSSEPREAGMLGTPRISSIAPRSVGRIDLHQNPWWTSCSVQERIVATDSPKSRLDLH